MPADSTMRTHCDDCDRRDLCDIIKRGTAPCRQNAGMGPAAADLLADFRTEVDRLRAERDSSSRAMSDPTPAAPLGFLAVTTLKSDESVKLLPDGSFVVASPNRPPLRWSQDADGEWHSEPLRIGAAPDQAEGPPTQYDPAHREIL